LLISQAIEHLPRKPFPAKTAAVFIEYAKPTLYQVYVKKKYSLIKQQVKKTIKYYTGFFNI